MHRIRVFFLGVCLCASARPAPAQPLEAGAGSFEFEDAAKRTITVWYYLPRTVKPTTPVLFVMHGVERNGKEYRDSWIDVAKAKHLILLTPEFSKDAFPGSDQYNLGDMLAENGRPNDRAQWTFTSIERIFDRVKELTRTAVPTYSIYGHSAGAQFVHRMVLFNPDARIATAISANAGWYTMPDFSVAFPYGLKKTAVTPPDLKKVLGRKLIILLGQEDTDPNHKYIRKSPEAEAQGATRLERGQNFMKAAKQAAHELGAKLEWDVKTVPGVGHSNSGMLEAAAPLLF